MLSAFRFFMTAIVAGLLFASPATAQDAEALPPVVLKAKNFDRSLLEPVEGISLRKDAHIAYDAFSNDEEDPDNAKLYARHGVTAAQFDKANETFAARMGQDKSMLITDLFGAYFYENAGGKYAAYAKDYAQSVLNDGPLKEKPPMSMDSYIELMAFYGRKADMSEDVTRKALDKVVAERGVTVLDIQIIGAWMGRQLKIENPR